MEKSQPAKEGWKVLVNSKKKPKCTLCYDKGFFTTLTGGGTCFDDFIGGKTYRIPVVIEKRYCKCASGTNNMPNAKPADGNGPYDIGQAVRDLTCMGGYNLTKGKAREILERLIASTPVKDGTVVTAKD
jgi:hypothetical protein